MGDARSSAHQVALIPITLTSVSRPDTSVQNARSARAASPERRGSGHLKASTHQRPPIAPAHASRTDGSVAPADPPKDDAGPPAGPHPSTSGVSQQDGRWISPCRRVSPTPTLRGGITTHAGRAVMARHRPVLRAVLLSADMRSVVGGTASAGIEWLTDAGRAGWVSAAGCRRLRDQRVGELETAHAGRAYGTPHPSRPFSAHRRDRRRVAGAGCRALTGRRR